MPLLFVFILRMKTLFKSSTKTFLSLFSIFFALFSFSQETKKDTTKVTELKEVTVSSVRAKDKNPITYTNVSKEEIAPRNLGQDVPVLLQYLPSVVSTTDAGNGVGYTSMRVRGSDGSRIKKIYGRILGAAIEAQRPVQICLICYVNQAGELDMVAPYFGEMSLIEHVKKVLAMPKVTAHLLLLPTIAVEGHSMESLTDEVRQQMIQGLAQLQQKVLKRSA